MARFLSAAYHPAIKVAEFICDDGRHLLRCGGTLPWRLNNAGDLMSPVNTNGEPAPRKTKNYIGFASVPNQGNGKTSHFFIFPDYAAGRQQLELSVRRLYADKTLPELVQKYAPPDSNKTAKYTEDLLNESGVGADKTIAELTDAEFSKVLDSIEKIEGYHNEADSRKEVWVPVSRITASDGARPLADEEIVLRLNGKDTTVKTNAYGQTPPIPHPNGQQIEALHKQASGELKSVGKIGGENGQHFSLTAWIERFSATPGPDKATGNASARRNVMAYTVQPHDTLGKLAARFNISADQIKRDNHLKSDMIFAGRQLGIYGPLPSGGATPAVKRAVPKADPQTKGKASPPAKASALTVRSKAGTGKPIATVRADQRMAPWMAVAYREATTYAGKKEGEITKTHNYHRLVTDSDRAGGRVLILKDKKGKPLLGKDGKPLTRIHFDGQSTLVGDHNAWCASFVNYCLKESTPTYAPGRKHMSTYTFGEDQDLFVRVKEPIYGAIRFTHRTGGGHVCFVYGEAAGKLVVVGGNQGDQICFELMNRGDPGESFFVPVPYKDYAQKDGAVLPNVDVEALKKEFGDAVRISDEQIRATKVTISPLA